MGLVRMGSVSDDIVTRLLHMAWTADENEPYADALKDAADEIQLLRYAFAFACGAVSTMPQYEHEPVETIMHMFLEEARHG
jgi:hypothetical protein